MCWRSANVTAIHKGDPFSDKENYLPISIIPILSKVDEKLVSHNLSNFCEKCGFLTAAQLAYRKGLGCTVTLLTKAHHLQKSLDAGMESYIVQLDFSAAFGRVSHSGLLLTLMSIKWLCAVHLQESSSPTVVRESFLLVLRVSGPKLFQACYREVCWVLFYLSYIAAI